jgi:hypothetical protein
MRLLDVLLPELSWRVVHDLQFARLATLLGPIREHFMPDIQQQIEIELRRVIGPAGYDVTLASQPDGRILVRIDSAEEVWGMCPDDLMNLLRDMPDRAGPLALRQAADQHPHKITCG